jgi:CDP-diacylglycerol--inositol 3-phosphatidyltransferase
LRCAALERAVLLAMGGTGQQREDVDNVWLFVPNLIGYFRIVALVVAFFVAEPSPLAFLVLYVVSFACDELDGRFARMLNQCSTFGAVLDMVTDRTATAALLASLAGASAYARLRPHFLALMVLDVGSHWFQMYAQLLLGASSHKALSASKPWLLRYYYGSRPFMGFCCISAEIALVALYVGRDGPEGPAGATLYATARWFGAACAPGLVLKVALNWMQLISAMSDVVEYDRSKRRSERQAVAAEEEDADIKAH